MAWNPAAMLPKLWAFYRRDLQIQLTYRLSLGLTMAHVLVSLTMFFFIGRLFQAGQPSAALVPYGGDYFRFVLLGMAFGGVMASAFSSVASTISFERGYGTLEAILLTPTPFPVVALGRAFWDIGASIATIVLYLLAGTLVFGADLSQANWSAVFPALVLTTAASLGLGMMSAAFSLVAREASPLDFAFGWATRFLAGVYFPVAVLPEWLRNVSQWLPLTHAVEAVRKTMILGAPLADVKRELWYLGGLSALIVPCGILAFHFAFNHARRRGHLVFDD
jgi:ABC-2 type transport system permease protein